MESPELAELVRLRGSRRVVGAGRPARHGRELELHIHHPLLRSRPDRCDGFRKWPNAVELGAVPEPAAAPARVVAADPAARPEPGMAAQAAARTEATLERLEVEASSEVADRSGAEGAQALVGASATAEAVAGAGRRGLAAAKAAAAAEAAAARAAAMRAAEAEAAAALRMTPVAQSVQAAPSGPVENPTTEVAAEHRAKAARVAAWAAVVLRLAAILGRVDVAVFWVPPSRSTPVQMLPSSCWGLRWPSSFAIGASVTDSSDDDERFPSRALDAETLPCDFRASFGLPAP